MRALALALATLAVSGGAVWGGDAGDRVAAEARPGKIGTDDHRPRILGATLMDPTDRYGHGVLGEAGEYATMRVAVATLFADKGLVMPRMVHIRLPEDRVFEDVDSSAPEEGVNPLLADLDGDGLPEIVVVESSADAGAALAIYAVTEGAAVEKIAATPPVGRRHRWLAPAGIADFDGDGRRDVVYVETPHIGGTLKLWTPDGTDIVAGPTVGGVSNHRIGQDFISGGVRDCGDGPELVLADAQWTRLLRAWIIDGAWQLEPVTRSVRPDLWKQALACEL